ncbi:MAG TPA: cupin domain-containing protein [Chitinophagales bacterium]|nr:cupin domain-containing protein [Chitinophagales bacterium]
MPSAKYWIEHLHLEPHPEGGYFRESYRSQGIIPASGLPTYIGSRNYATCIYYLLPGNEFSAFHRLKSDEVWHFYDGCSLNLHIVLPEGTLITKVLGKIFETGESLQHVVPAYHWFAAKPTDSDSYSLAGCTMSPGFDVKDFELGIFEELTKQYPQHTDFIRLLVKA